MASFEAQYVPPPQVDREVWAALLAQCPSAPVYVQPWYMDAVTDNGWSLVLVYQGEQLVAGLPLYVKHKYLWQYSYQPPFTQTWGPIVHPDVMAQKQPYVKLEQLFEEIIAQLPEKLADHQFASPAEQTFLLPFHQAGYALNTRYSYQIAPGQFDSEKAVVKSFSRQLRRKLKDLPEEYSIESGSIEDYLQLLPKAGAHFQNAIYSHTAVQLMQAGLENDAVDLWQVAHQDKSVAFLAIFHTTYASYTLVGLMHDDHRRLSPMTALYAKGIWHAQEMGRIFDFEGSMQPDIAYYFSRFGGTPVPYINLRRKCLTKLTWPSP